MHGTDAFTEPAKRRLRDGAAPARGRRDHRRPDPAAELAICGFTESATYGVTRNPWNPQRTPGGSSGGSGRGGRRRPGPDRLGRRRRRLDPHPRRLLRPLRPEALARPDLARARARRLERARGPRLPQPHRARHRALARHHLRRLAASPRRRRRPSGPSSSRRKTPPGKLRVAWSTAARRAPRRRRPSPTTSSGRSPTPPSCSRSLGHEVAQRDPDWGDDRQQHHRRASCAASPRPSRKCRTPSASNAAPAASAASARILPDALYERALRGREADAARDQRDLRLLRRAGHPGDGRHRAAGPPLGGPRRPAHRARDEPLLSLLRPLEPPRQPGDVGARRASPPTACRSRSRSSAAPATRRRCSRSPPRSRPSGPGRTRRPPIS